MAMPVENNIRNARGYYKPPENNPFIQSESRKKSAAANLQREPGRVERNKLLDSLAIALSGRLGRRCSAEKLTVSQRVSEQDLFCALTHNKLNELRPRVASKFEQELRKTIDRMRDTKGADLMFKATDRILRGLIRSNDISQDEYRAVRDYAFGMAQLDSNRSQLKGLAGKDNASNTGTTWLIEALNSISENMPASSEEISAYKAEEAALARAKHGRGGKAGDAGKGAHLKTGVNSAARTSEAAMATGGISSAPFIWKPVSESDGKLVIVLPASLTTNASAVRILSPDRSGVLEAGRFMGVGVGGRQIYRFPLPGSRYPEGCVVEITMRDGSSKFVTIEKPASRNEIKGV